MRVTFNRPHALAVAMAALVLAAAQPADGASIRECGNYGYTADGAGPMWTFRDIAGAGVYNLTTRRVGCRSARRYVEKWQREYGGGRVSYVGGYRCTDLAWGAYELQDIRCVRSRGRVIRWQQGA
jgi:hypothetical protein